MTASSPQPPSFPPSASAPSVPEGWKAEWSKDHKTWYFHNATTKTTQWENPTMRVSAPPQAPPAYASTQAWATPLTDRSFGEKSGTSNYGYSDYYTQGANGAAPPLPPQILYIHSAAYHDQDVTEQVRRMVSNTQTLTFNTHNLDSHFGDPWPNNRKQFSVVYSYGQRPWEVAATIDSSGFLYIRPHELNVARSSFVQDVKTTRVVAAIWGNMNAMTHIQGRTASLKLKELEVEGRLEATNGWAGFDGAPNVLKIMVVYYRRSDGTVGFSTAMENHTCRLPWNPLAADF